MASKFQEIIKGSPLLDSFEIPKDKGTLSDSRQFSGNGFAVCSDSEDERETYHITNYIVGKIWDDRVLFARFYAKYMWNDGDAESVTFEYAVVESDGSVSEFSRHVRSGLPPGKQPTFEKPFGVKFGAFTVDDCLTRWNSVAAVATECEII